MFGIFSNKPLSELSLEELKSQEKSAQTALRWFGIFVLAMIAFVAFWTGTKGYNPINLIFLLASCSLPAIAAAKLKQIRTEISSRV
ncbi:hypothetical protein ACFSUS_27770 [Spirosoma soli]|uniref:Uncharacterized protein n=1 Tax=Spirosoma soli TaxID=1770529 RepID=A0ABW5MBL4_9BACT